MSNGRAKEGGIGLPKVDTYHPDQKAANMETVLLLPFYVSLAGLLQTLVLEKKFSLRAYLKNYLKATNKSICEFSL